MAVEAVVRPLTDPGWAAFSTNHPDALPFHHPSWAALLAECYGFRAFGLAVEDGGELVAGLPVIEIRRRRGAPRWVSLPFTDHCPPLAGARTVGAEAGAEAGGEADAGAALGDLLDAVRRERGIERFEVRGELRGPGVRTGGTYLTHRLSLDGTEAEIFATLHANQVRRNIRRAERAGVTVRTGTVEADVTGVFYRLHTMTRHRLGVPVQPLRYFRLLWRHVLEPGLGTVLIAELAGEPVAAGIFLASPGTCVYKYGASDERHWSARPNHLLFWTAIRWAAARGCRVFDFGRSDATDVGLREFKSRWGTVEQELAYSVLTEGPVGGGRTGLPSPVRWVIRHGPRFVPRAVGEVLYRYTA